MGVLALMCGLGGLWLVWLVCFADGWQDRKDKKSQDKDKK